MKSASNKVLTFSRIKADTDLLSSQLADELLVRHSDSSVSAAAYGDLIDQFRKSLDLPAREFAEKLNVSISTYNRWRAGDGDEKPPIHRVKQFKELMRTETTPETTRNSIFFDQNKRLTIRPFDQILDRQNKSSEAWFFKHLIPFRAGKVGPIRNQIVDLLIDPNHQVTFHCVFLGPKAENIYKQPEKKGAWSRFPAMDSFAELKKAVFKRDPTAAKERLRGWLVNDAGVAFKVGLSNHLIGTTILVYDEKRTSGIPNLRDRKVDIFQELPLAIYQATDHTQLHSGVETRWLEIEPNLSLRHYELAIAPALSLITQGNHKGVVEFMRNEQQIASYIPRLWD